MLLVVYQSNRDVLEDSVMFLKTGNVIGAIRSVKLSVVQSVVQSFSLVVLTQYKPGVAICRLSTIHDPALEPGTHDVSYHLPSNPSSPLTLLVLGAVIQRPALVCPIHCPASCLVCPLDLPSLLSSCLVLGVQCMLCHPAS